MQKSNRIVKQLVIFIVVLFLLLISVAGYEYIHSTSFRQNLERSASNDNLAVYIDSVIVQTMNRYSIPGLSVGVVREGTILFSGGYGITDIANKKPVTDSSIFHTASVSKLFTAIAILQLQQAGKLSFQSKLAAIVPELNYSDNRVKDITILQLLNHTSGLPDITNYHWEEQHADPAALRIYILNNPLATVFTPGSQYQYSNLGYNLLGYVIEKVSELPFEEYMQQYILYPAGMHQSDFRYFNIPEHLRVTGHSKTFFTKRVFKRETYPYSREHAASSTLEASAKEISSWMVQFMNALQQDTTSFYKQLIKPSFSGNDKIGLGFRLGTLDNRQTAGHYGGDKGFRSVVMMVPGKQNGIVLLANCDYNEEFRTEIANAVLKKL